jgi:hypothetical protein
VVAKLSTTYKRQESEADVVGGMLCGQFGMPAAMYRQAIIGFLSSADDVQASSHGSGAISKPEQLRDGDAFEMPLEDLTYFLFQIDDHPTTQERSDQLQRVGDAVTKHFASSGLLAEWLTDYGQAAGGLSLTDTPVQLVRQVRTSDGRTIIVPKRYSRRPAVPGKSRDPASGP